MMPIIKECTMNCSPRYRDNHKDCDDCYVNTERDIDFAAVQNLAAAMIVKLDKKRAEGRTGWWDASAEDLSKMLISHVFKGDPVDVANFCMMLHYKQQAIINPLTAPAKLHTPKKASPESLQALANEPYFGNDGAERVWNEDQISDCASTSPRISEYQYFTREIGESDWKEVTFSEFKQAQSSPQIDHKKVEVQP
jgi:hypothetical protein